MNLTTPVAVRPAPSISHSSGLLLIGSCFIEHIARALSALSFDTVVNPAGITYNPISIADQLRRLAERRPYEPGEIQMREGLAFAPTHHGCFSSGSVQETFAKISKSYDLAADFLSRASHIVITLGSSAVYEHDGQVWNNCHKLPGREFHRRLLSMDEVTEALTDAFRRLPARHIILTVSPVRYPGDDNSVNKATLLLAARHLAEADTRVVYFPAYEIMMDELRDYRFYADDMLHPSGLAADIIMERFARAYFTPATQRLCRAIADLGRRQAHRPLHPDTPQYAEFKQKTEQYEKTILDALARSRSAADDCTERL